MTDLREEYIQERKREILESMTGELVREAIWEEPLGEHGSDIIAVCIQHMNSGDVLQKIGEKVIERVTNYAEDIAKMDYNSPKFDEWLANRERIEKEAKRMGMRPDMI